MSFTRCLPEVTLNSLGTCYTTCLYTAVHSTVWKLFWVNHLSWGILRLTKWLQIKSQLSCLTPNVPLNSPLLCPLPPPPHPIARVDCEPHPVNVIVQHNSTKCQIPSLDGLILKGKPAVLRAPITTDVTFTRENVHAKYNSVNQFFLFGYTSIWHCWKTLARFSTKSPDKTNSNNSCCNLCNS